MSTTQPSNFGDSPAARRSAAAIAPLLAETMPPGLADHPDYELIRELGHGGMGVVYLAHNRLMCRDEVLKVMGRHIMERPGLLARFLGEIRAVARLQHPNIVTAYSAFRLGDSILFAMEYVEGLDLARLVKANGPLPLANACSFAHQAAQGMQHAHEQGMVHRDIKPGNLMLSSKGNRARVKVLDFGLAKATRESPVDAALTNPGQALGTPDYMAPEQIRDAQKADIRADIYSLGCTLYYLLSGGPPFRAENLWDLYQAHHSMDARQLHFLRPDVPSELAALVAKMMAKEPELRFQTPVEVAQALVPFFKKGSASSSVPTQDEHQIGVLNERPEAPSPRSVSAESAKNESTAQAATATEQKTSPHPEAVWEGLVELGEARKDADPVTVNHPSHRTRWIWPSVVAGVMLIGLLAWDLGALRIEDGMILLGYNPPKEIRPFNGKDFRGWDGASRGRKAEPSAIFHINGDEFVWNNNPGQIYFQQSLRNFRLRFEYLIRVDGDNGHAHCLLKIAEGDFCEFRQVPFRVSEIGFSLTNSKDRRFGKIADIIPYKFDSGEPDRYVKPGKAHAIQQLDVWNVVEIRSADHGIVFFFNGQQVNRIESKRPLVWYPGFQSDGTYIRFRNIQINQLDDSEIAAQTQDAFQPMTKWVGENIMKSKYHGDRRIHEELVVVERNGDSFKARWNSTRLYGRWEVRGTIRDGQISWLETDVKRASGLENRTYNVVGNIEDEEISLHYEGIDYDMGKPYSSRLTLSLAK
jgi:serine/threonine protein kinase